MPSPYEERVYDRGEVVTFRKTREMFGGLSNMAAGYAIVINGEFIRTSEALYQACRFPHRQEVQKLIIQQRSPMSAKMKSKPYRADSRADWDDVRVTIMRWCLRVKLVQNWSSFGELLLSTGSGPIVEESNRDSFWGAMPVGPDILKGANVLGRLLRQLRDQLLGSDAQDLRTVLPPHLSNFLLYGAPIGPIHADDFGATSPVARPRTKDAGKSMVPVVRYQEVVHPARQVMEGASPDWEPEPLPPDDWDFPVQAAFPVDGLEASPVSVARQSKRPAASRRPKRRAKRAL